MFEPRKFLFRLLQETEGQNREEESGEEDPQLATELSYGRVGSFTQLLFKFEIPTDVEYKITSCSNLESFSSDYYRKPH